MNYRISNEAANDLEKIWVYTVENWSVEQAERYLGLVFEEIDYLCRKPESSKDYSHIRKGYFCSRVKSHLIFFRINKSKVEIIRILHEMMDVERHLI